ncbi:hypothetical protein [Planomonospora venezuelensis]|uniref:Uncharacterized protein n=1 Tax=Planomonospora venezuelensis TaxID=1999 RepID=A0A841DCK3_PLAVE|nr:hypothetical protein [Planomonospora venezuelensis]MBB5965086.1 hypothetical protein [Planomonospora venezuelensis]GIN04996.1 hypothetical protein Pve01_66540 [Planomonospora venezuelensis]
MVTDSHIEFLKEQLAQAERDVAGWRQILGHAEQVARAGTPFPDPMVDDVPMFNVVGGECRCGNGVPGVDGHGIVGCGLVPPMPETGTVLRVSDLRRQPGRPYTPPAFDATLPPNQENALQNYLTDTDAERVREQQAGGRG